MSRHKFSQIRLTGKFKSGTGTTSETKTIHYINQDETNVSNEYSNNIADDILLIIFIYVSYN